MYRPSHQKFHGSVNREIEQLNGTIIVRKMLSKLSLTQFDDKLLL